MVVALSSSLPFESVISVSLSYIIKIFPSSDISVIWIDIWDFQEGSKSKTLINHTFNFGQHTIIV